MLPPPTVNRIKPVEVALNHGQKNEDLLGTFCGNDILRHAYPHQSSVFLLSKTPGMDRESTTSDATCGMILIPRIQKFPRKG